MLHGKVLLAQGGGPTAVINQSLVGIVLEALKHESISHVYGSMHGVNGIINQNFVDLSEESKKDLELIAATPCSALGSTRDKPDLKYCREIFRVLKAHDISTFFYIGGNDSSDSLKIIANQASIQNYSLKCIHIPKTIDNDLMANDHTPGFPSAAKFVASAFAGINQDNRALPGIYIGVVMGRHAGFLTAASAFGRQNKADGPHLIYLPEREFKIDNFVADIKKTYDKYGRCIIAVSEGICDNQDMPIITKLKPFVEKDAHGNIQLSGTGALADTLTAYIKTKMNVNRVRGDTFGYLQRSFLGCVSEVDQHEARQVGVKGIQFAALENCGGTITINRTNQYGIDYRLNSLDDVAGKTKIMPSSFIAVNGTDITKDFCTYLRPLLGTFKAETHNISAKAVKKLNIPRA